MATEIRIASQYLKNLEQRSVIVVAKLQSYSQLPGDGVTSSAEVGAGYTNLANRWDQRRGELLKGLDAAITAMGTIRKAFEEADAKLATQLEGTSG